MEEKNLSRRQVVGGLATGLAAVASPVALGAQGGVGNSDAPQTNPQSAKQDPTSQYPKPPFPRQTQPWPGLASKMEPRPDHGETSYRGSGRLKGRKALVTGGDSGIGRAAVIAMAREGADIVFNHLPQEEPDAQEVISLLRGEGRKIVSIPGDIRTEKFCQHLVESAVKELGGLDIVVNNAARQQQRPKLEDLTSEDFDATFKTNVYAPFWITKAALPHLGAGSAIIFTTSVQAYDPSENLIDYAQTKACLMNLTKSLAKQLAPKGIRVNGVAPGPYWTPLQPSGGQDPEKLPQFGADTPMGRPGQPAELGPVYVLLASQEASYATGQVYGASGGHGNP
jgi:NAD(P)-dependent dehydrogenase (short-subunit alcohol dehydrogenase family)